MLSQLKFEENENCSKTDNKIRSKLKVTVHDLLQFLFSWLSIVYVCLQARAKHQNVNGFIRNSESKIWMTVCWFRRQRNHSKWMNIEWISFAWARYCRRDVVHETGAHGKFEATLRVECSLTLHTAKSQTQSSAWAESFQNKIDDWTRSISENKEDKQKCENRSLAKWTEINKTV